MQYLVLVAAEDLYQHAIEFFCLEGLGSCAVLQWHSSQSSAGLRWLDTHTGLFKVTLLCSFHDTAESTVCTLLAAGLNIGKEFGARVLSVLY